MSEPTSGALVTAAASAPTLTAVEIKAQVKHVQEVMRAVMKPGEHYGTVTSGGKPSLFKAGSEVLLSTFRIAVEPEVEDLSTRDEIRYRIILRGRHIPTGLVVGAGVGECSTGEEKYKWRAAVCDEEFDEADEDRRRIKYSSEWGDRRGERVVKRTQQVRQNPADLANTILKMAKKRAQIDLTLTALAASDIFVQDYEDEDGTLHPAAAAEDTRNIKPRTAAPQATSSPAADSQEGGAPKITPKQIGLLKHRLQDSNVAASEFLAHFELNDLGDLEKPKMNGALDWIRDRARR